MAMKNFYHVSITNSNDNLKIGKIKEFWAQTESNRFISCKIKMIQNALLYQETPNCLRSCCDFVETYSGKTTAQNYNSSGRHDNFWVPNCERIINFMSSLFCHMQGSAFDTSFIACSISCTAASWLACFDKWSFGIVWTTEFDSTVLMTS